MSVGSLGSRREGGEEDYLEPLPDDLALVYATITQLG